jgi:hypothetical protein
VSFDFAEYLPLAILDLAANQRDELGVVDVFAG